MTFTNPAGWWLLGLAIPIVLLHVLRPRREPVTVSSTLLWRKVERPVSAAAPWQRLRMSWLLILQLLAVALLAALVAHPVRLTEAPLAEHTVFIVDASGSMAAVDGRPDRLASAADRARELRRDLPEGGRASIVVAGQQARVLLTASADASAFSSALDRIEPTEGRASFAEAFALAESLETGVGAIGFVLLSDGGLTDEEIRLLPPGTTYQRIGDRAMNRAISRLTAEPRGSGLHVRATVHNTGGPAASQPLRIDVDGRTEATVDVELGPGESQDFELDVPAGDRIAAYLDGSDLLDADDTAVAVARRRQQLTVMIAGDATFLQPLLTAIPGVTVVTSPSARPLDEGQDLAIYNGVAVPEDPGGPFLAVAPPGGIAGVTPTGTVVRPAVTLVRADDPLLVSLDLSEVAVASAERVDVPTADVLVAAADGSPLVLRGTAGPWPFAYLAFALADSNLPLQVAFPILGDRLVTELAGVQLPSAPLEVGQALPVAAGRTTTVTDPAGRSSDLDGDGPAPVADRSGFWVLEGEGTVARTVAVNPSPAESTLAPVDRLPVEARQPSAGVRAARGERSLVGWLAVALLAVLVAEYLIARRSRGVSRRQWRVAGALRLVVAGLLLAVVLAPVISRPATRVATVFVLDASDSLGPAGRAAASSWVVDALRGRGNDDLAGVVVFGGDARLERIMQESSAFDGPTVRVDPERTNLAAALRLGAAVLPDDARRRIVLVTDGRQTEGDALAEAARLGEEGIPVDVHVVHAAGGVDAAVAAVDTPSLAREGEAIEITATVSSTDAGAAVLSLTRNGQPVTTRAVDLSVGENQVTFTDTAGSSGVSRYQVTVQRGNDTIAQNDTAFAAVPVEGPARVLLAEGSTGEGAALAAALRAGGLSVDVIGASALSGLAELSGYTSTVLVDVESRSLSAQQLQDLTTAVEDLGRGLVTVGGDRSYGVGGYRASPIEELLPVVSEILDPLRRQTVAEVLSIDTSGSMAACHCSDSSGLARPSNRVVNGVNKTDISRAAAARTIAALAQDDEVGVLAWSGAAEWIIDLQQLPADEVVSSGLSRLQPDGETNLRESLREAADALRASTAALKHIILFTDGFTDPANITAVASQAGALYESDGITTSVVATGEGAAPALERIAVAGHGRFYPGEDLDQVPQIIADEAVLASRDFINEGEFLPLVTSSAPVVADLTAAPPLFGYVATTAKPTATTLLRIGPDQDPLLATWPAGLGRVTSWTSDASRTWSKSWAEWSGYVGFWTGVVKDTFPAGETAGAVRAVVRDGRLEVTVESATAFPDSAEGRATVTGPDGQRLDVTLERTSPTTFAGEVEAPRAGTYAVAGTVRDGEQVVLTSTGLASESYPAEFRPGPADEMLLRRLSTISGGRGALDDDAAFDANGLATGVRRVALRSPFLLAAALLWPIAVIVSRLSFRGVALADVRRSTGRTARRMRDALPRLPGRDPLDEPPPRQDPPSPAEGSTLDKLLKGKRGGSPPTA